MRARSSMLARRSSALHGGGRVRPPSPATGSVVHSPGCGNASRVPDDPLADLARRSSCRMHRPQQSAPQRRQPGPPGDRCGTPPCGPIHAVRIGRLDRHGRRIPGGDGRCGRGRNVRRGYGRDGKLRRQRGRTWRLGRTRRHGRDGGDRWTLGLRRRVVDGRYSVYGWTRWL